MRRTPTEMGVMALVFVFFLAIVYSVLPEPARSNTNYCPLPPTLLPEYANAGVESSMRFYTNQYSNQSLKLLQGAVRIPTVSFDDMAADPLADDRFAVFSELHKYLFASFPLTARHVEIVNGYGLLYTFEGSLKELKPLVLMSHQDVVPVVNEEEWAHPPFEAHFDGEFVTGRGVADTKDTLVGILEAVESLLAQNWVPQRTLILSFGFDEEISGFRGALELSKVIEQRYGPNGAVAIVDEGFGMPEMHGALVATVAVSEKGYLDISVDLHTPGGHSSEPKDHTSIGIMSQLVKRLESNPFRPELNHFNPTLQLFRCAAEHAPNMNMDLRRTVLDLENAGHLKKLTNYIDGIPSMRYLIKSSQAADILNGGIKVNALPEKVSLRVNHRISPNSGVGALMERFEDHVISVAEEFGLGILSNGETLLPETANGLFNISTGHALEPSPVSPHAGPIWDTFAGTTLGALSRFPLANLSNAIAAPSLFPANTDTRHYWNLSRAIYRFKPVLGTDALNVHTVNEQLRFRSHLLTVAWYYDLVLTFDARLDL